MDADDFAVWFWPSDYSGRFRWKWYLLIVGGGLLFCGVGWWNSWEGRVSRAREVTEVEYQELLSRKQIEEVWLDTPGVIAYLTIGLDRDGKSFRMVAVKYPFTNVNPEFQRWAPGLPPERVHVSR